MERVMTSWLGQGTVLLEGDGGFNPIQTGPWELYFWTVLVFVLLLVILTKFLWRPILQTVGKREDQISGDLEKAEEARREAEEAREKHRQEMDAVAQSAKAVLDEARERASSLKVDLERQARAAADGIVAKARQQIEAEKVQAMQDIRDQIVDLSVEITKQIVEKAVDREDHLRIAAGLVPKVKDM